MTASVENQNPPQNEGSRGAITVAIAVLTVVLSAVQIGSAWLQRRTDLSIAKDTRQHEVMSEYLEEMTDLLVDEDGSVKKPNEYESSIAGAITLNASRQLADPERKGQLLKFLYDSKLIGRCNLSKELEVLEPCEGTQMNLSGVKLIDAKLEQPAPALAGINLSGASLDGAVLPEITLIKATLEGAKLEKAVLNGADLTQADMRRARLSDAKLKGARLQNAVLEGADLKKADLRGANLSNAYLKDADLRGANLSNIMLQGAKYSKPGTQFSEGFDPAAHGMQLCNQEDIGKVECKL
ncbi:MAG: pentapeptide repeat-containing protein [Cyanobacteria bacterium RM1_2_2]|nr:pentapeptide repeat-containing protein [Cyanobacteria bacterium RM1_2_2]